MGQDGSWQSKREILFLGGYPKREVAFGERKAESG
jgi:hypothetical protein